MRLHELLITAVLTVIVIANLFDMGADLSSGASAWHLVEEGLVVLASLTVIVGLMIHLRRQKRALDQIRLEFSKQQQEAVPASAELLQARKQLGSVIRQQFLDWQLTGSEQEVAMLLLKGLSFKEIAVVRDTHEKTVRQQASAIYKKAGVSGRHAFSAWFIEDFL
jgi:DNA-binding CsgD family transcriptional regulator